MALSLFIHPDVTKFLRSNQEQKLVAQIWQCIDKLKKKQFDGGLRVKKLKGIGRIWEARVTQASRLLFAYCQSTNAEKSLFIQDVCIDHDDVSRSAKRARKQTVDSKWLFSEEDENIEIIGNLDQNINSLSQEEQQKLELELKEDLKISEQLKDQLLSNTAWQVVPETEKEWQRAIIENQADFALKLTPEESDLVELKGNFLLRGSAGTGKTTVGVYRLKNFARDHHFEGLVSGKSLYIAYNPKLVEEAQSLFKRLLNIDLEENLNKFADIFRFTTIKTLCSNILDKNNYLDRDNEEVNFNFFASKYSRHPQSKKFPTFLVWDEIRSIIKGSQLDPDQDLLSQQDYFTLGKKRSHIITEEQRPQLYELATWYQNLLEKEQRVDEIDLARKALKLVADNKSPSYQLIICDEVQDLTELQLELLIKLIPKRSENTRQGNFYFTGDIHQRISPSAFRWEDLKTRLYKSNLRYQEKQLYINFRNVGSLANLANQVLALRYRLFGQKLQQSNLQKTLTYDGEKASLIIEPVNTLQPILEKIRATEAIIVKTKEVQDKLKKQFQSELIYTIEEAKGLEFDTVFLVDFFSDKPRLWQKLLVQQRKLKEIEKPELELEFNLLYVAITRARRILRIWEPEKSRVWNKGELQNLVNEASVERVQESRSEDSPELWKERGLQELNSNNGNYERAIECFRNAGEIKLETEATARLRKEEGKYASAADLFQEIELWEDAARLLEKELKQFSQAAECWEQASNLVRAAECWEQGSNWEKAADCYELLDRNKKAAECWERNKSWDKAGEIWLKLQSLDHAKTCFTKAGNNHKVAEINAIQFESSELFLEAAEEYNKAEMSLKVAECYSKYAQLTRNEDNYFEAVKYWLKASRIVSDKTDKQKEYEEEAEQYYQYLNQYQVKQLITNRDIFPISLDIQQRKVSEQIPDSVQRIKGITGSGKTTVLCRRIAYIHLKHPDWDIAVVFWDQSFSQDIERRIDAYLKNLSNDEVTLAQASNKIRIFSAWGNNEREGFYSHFREQLGLPPHKVASLLINDFSQLVSEALKQGIEPCFDVILIDETQDLLVDSEFKFPGEQTISWLAWQSFYWLAWQSLKPVSPETPDIRRLYYADDEFKNLSTNTIIGSKFKEAFGQNLVDEIEKKNNSTEILKFCYRTPSSTLVTALTLGTGLLRKEGILYPLDKENLSDVGFEIVGDFLDNNQMQIWRESNDFSNAVDQLWQQELIEYHYFDSLDEQIEALIKKVQFAANIGFNVERDLMIICLGENPSKLVSYVTYKFKQYHSLPQTKLNFFLPGKSGVKGNEAYWVFLVGLENIAQNEANISLRNQLFTAMTRTKGWLWIGGVKPNKDPVSSLYEELAEAINYQGKVSFYNRLV